MAKTAITNIIHLEFVHFSDKNWLIQPNLYENLVYYRKGLKSNRFDIECKTLDKKNHLISDNFETILNVIICTLSHNI